MCKFSIAGITGNKIVGRNVGDYPIEIGEIFEFVKCYKPREKLADLNKVQELIKSTPVFLKVVGIEMYGKNVERICSVETGVLTLEGRGLEELIYLNLVLETDELRPEYDLSSLKPTEKGKYATKYKLKQLKEEIRKVLSGYIGDPVSPEIQDKYVEEIMNVYKKLFEPNIEVIDDGSTKDMLKLKIKSTFDGKKENENVKKRSD
jgi:hypothetical protein